MNPQLTDILTKAVAAWATLAGQQLSADVLAIELNKLP
jgi:hypothetical protein